MDFGSLLTAMITPFTPEGEVNYGKARELASHLVAEGCDGLVICGTTGEVPTLTMPEKLKLLENIVDEVGDKANVVAGTGNYNTVESIEFSQKAEEIGVDGLMLVVPYYNKPPQNALYQHFTAIADQVEVPIMLYNVPGRTAKNLDAETTISLAQHENIIAIKEASGDLEQATEILAQAGDQIAVYSGDDSLTLPLLALGGTGVVSVAGHLVAAEIKDMVTAAHDNDFAKARKINTMLHPLFKTLFITTNPIPVKTALELMGWQVGGFRLPLYQMEEDKLEQLHQILEYYKLI
ncbi:MAG: 4-hydroxy-tetrahydrodipicolinate synthase [Bacillota bacterium]